MDSLLPVGVGWETEELRAVDYMRRFVSASSKLSSIDESRMRVQHITDSGEYPEAVKTGCKAYTLFSR